MPLDPQGADSSLEPIELILFPTKARKGQHAIRAASVGQRAKELLEDTGQKILDQRTKKRRQLRGGDIAILCPTHNMLSEYAVVLRSQGLRVRLQEGGWYSSRIVQVACQALAYVANPSDRHAALYLSVTELGSLDLEIALKQLIAEGQIHEPILEKLDRLATEVVDHTVYGLVADTFSALNLFDVVTVWPDADQARANLLRLQAEAGEFMDANREALASGGFHGSNIQNFLAWLDAKVEHKDKNNQPDPRVIDEDAIQLITWHSSKGREWPIVFVSGMDRSIKPKLPNMSLGYNSFDDLSQLLAKAQIEYSPKFSAPETDDQFLGDLGITLEIESRRLIYVAMTRARDKLVLEWPSYLTGKDELTYWSILTAEAGVSLENGSISAGGVAFPCVITEGESELPVDIDLAREISPNALSTIGRRAIRREAVPENLTPDSVTPSEIENTNLTESEPPLEVAHYHGGLDLDIELAGTQLGTFLHRCFEVLGSNPGQVDHLAKITGVDLNDVNSTGIANNVASFEEWLSNYFAAKSVFRELPLLALDENESVISGTADLVLETDKGVWVIDHKSDQVDDPEAAFGNYRPQLECYATLLSSMGHKVLGLGINWIRRGEVVLVCAVNSSRAT